MELASINVQGHVSQLYPPAFDLSQPAAAIIIDREEYQVRIYNM
jgi:hypothetical protein